MPRASFHDEQAEHNEAFYDSIDTSRYPDWGTVVLFYAALHQWEAYASEAYGADTVSHTDRAGQMDADVRMTLDAERAYADLKDMAWIARYMKWKEEPTIASVEASLRPQYECFKQWASQARQEL